MVGGWALPALHHHGDSCTHASHLACPAGDIAQHSHLHGDHEHYGHSESSGDLNHSDHDHQSCSHHHVVANQASGTENSTAQDSPSQPIAVYGQDSWGCDGLCALCVARTLTTTQSGQLLIVSFGDVSVKTHVLGDLACDLKSLEGCHSPRGPPQDLV